MIKTIFEILLLFANLVIGIVLISSNRYTGIGNIFVFCLLLSVCFRDRNRSNQMKESLDDLKKDVEKHLFEYYLKNRKTYKTFFLRRTKVESYDDFYDFDKNMDNYVYYYSYWWKRNEERNKDTSLEKIQFLEKCNFSLIGVLIALLFFFKNKSKE